MAAAILLAAGLSTRMGSPKADLLWRGTALLEYCIAELGAAEMEPIVVVLGQDADSYEARVQAGGAIPVTNTRYREGRATSIAAGAAVLAPETSAILVCSVDQPRPRTIYERLAALHRGGITRAVYAGLHGHPTVFDGSLLGELATVSEAAAGMKSLLRSYADRITDVDCDDPIVLVNLNTPEQYAAALRVHGW